MNAAKRRQVWVVCVVAAGVAAWGYAGVSWWRKDRNRVIVRRPDVAPGTAVVTPDQAVEIAHEKWPVVTLDGKSSAPTTATVMEQYTASIHDLFHDSFQRRPYP